MKGVTLTNFRRYVKADATKADLRKITDAQVATVYRRFYWDATAGAQLPGGVDYAVFDFAVHSGPGQCCAAYEPEPRPYDFDYLHNVCRYLKANNNLSVDSLFILFKSLML